MAVKHTHSRQRERKKECDHPQQCRYSFSFSLFSLLLMRKANGFFFCLFESLGRPFISASFTRSSTWSSDVEEIVVSFLGWFLFPFIHRRWAFFFAISSSSNDGKVFHVRRMLDGRSDCLQVTHMSNCVCGCASWMDFANL